MLILKIIIDRVAALGSCRLKRVARGDAAKVPVRISLAAQWQRLTDTLTQSIDRAEQAQQLQAAATRQLDLAQYAMTTLMDELSAVMTVPGRRASAVVHRFEPLALRPVDQALAA